MFRASMCEQSRVLVISCVMLCGLAATADPAPEDATRLNLIDQIDINTDIGGNLDLSAGSSSVTEADGEVALNTQTIRVRDGAVIDAIINSDPFTILEVSGGQIDSITLFGMAPIPPQFGGPTPSDFADAEDYFPANLLLNPVPNLLITDNGSGPPSSASPTVDFVELTGPGRAVIDGPTVGILLAQDGRATREPFVVPGSPTIELRRGGIDNINLNDQSRFTMYDDTTVINANVSGGVNFEMFGGFVDFLRTTSGLTESDSQTHNITIHDGMIRVLFAGIDSPSNTYNVVLNGGEFEILAGFSDGQITINDGLFRETASTTGDMDVFGGTFEGGLATSRGGNANLFGGTISNIFNDLPDLRIYGESVFNIFGTDFNFAFGEIDLFEGNLTGLLSDGTQLDVLFSRETDARIVLHELSSAVPLPTAAIMGAALLSGLTTRRRQR